MRRSFWLQAIAYALSTATAILIVLPSVVHPGQLPRWMTAHARTMRPSVDVVGGLRFVYEASVEEVESARMDLLAPVLEQRLREEQAVADVVAAPQQDGAMVVKFGRPASQGRLSTALIDDLGLREIDRREDQGLVVLRLKSVEVARLYRQEMDRAVEKLHWTFDDHFGSPRHVEREGDGIAIELPGGSLADAARARSLIERL